MSDDPKPTIRIASCRGDGRCPECGDTPRPRDPILTCGCKVDTQWCINGHWRALLTEALNRLQTVQQDLQEARRERDMFEERAWKYEQLCR